MIDHIIGELSASLGDLLIETPASVAHEVRDLRVNVETEPEWRLRLLAHDAIKLAETICALDLDDGDMSAFCRDVDRTVALRDFAECANLLQR